MVDVLLIGLVVAFFAAASLLVSACERIVGRGEVVAGEPAIASGQMAP